MCVEVAAKFRSWYRQLGVCLIVCLMSSACAATPVLQNESVLSTPVQPTPPPGSELPWPLELPPGYRISLYAQGLEEVRSIAFNPDGVPYVTVMNRDEAFGGKVLALPDADGDGWAERTVTVAESLDRPHGIMFHEGQLYVSEAGNLFRMHDADGDMIVDTRDLIVTEMPTRGDHWSRPFVFTDDGAVLVAIGSSCNACQEGDKQRATILRFDPNTTTVYPGTTVFARGLRSVVGMEIRPGTQELWVTNNARDELGPELPPDQIFHVKQDLHYGWPYCYGDRVLDEEVALDHSIVTPDGSPKDQFCREKVTSPDLVLPPHVAPLGLTFYEGAQFPEEVHGDMFVAYHGAFDFANTYGYRVVRIPFTEGRPGAPEDFITGWVPEGASTWLGRPVDVAVSPEGSLYVTDDVNGYLYRVDYVGA